MKIYNTLTRKKENFVPINQSEVKMYVCGPTVYDKLHIGNARSLVVYDLLFRVLKTQHNNIVYARNITDVDDKIINRFNEKKSEFNNDIKQFTEHYIKTFHENCQYLKCLAPTFEPKATEEINTIIEFIQDLINKNYAYKIPNDGIYFDVNQYKKYGCLSNKKPDDLISGARVDVNKNKKSSADFVLWKNCTQDEYGFDSELGRGRPGWHIECSAMSNKYLGKTFDIHGGGVDLVFPHHENEMAQSICRNQCNFANYWVHNGFLKVNGQKMSKSLGNFITIHEVAEKYSGSAVKLALLSASYSKPLNFEEGLITDFQNFINDVSSCVFEDTKIDDKVDVSPLLDDLNSAVFISNIRQNFKKGNLEKTLSGLKFLGIEFIPHKLPDEIKRLANERLQAKQDKNFSKSDELRDLIKSKGFDVIDNPSGYSIRLLK